MAGALSGHLIDQYNPNSQFNSSIVSHGAMSFNPNMHGTPYAQQSFSFFGSQPSNESISEETAKKIAALQVKLNQKLGPEYISQRPGPGGGPKLTYVEGWKIINLANEVFGFHGWSSSIVSLTTDFADYNEENRRYSVGVTALMRVTLRDGVFHEDIGYGMLENSKSKGAALDKCKKEAVTDGLKRALRSFGNVMGNCLYDKTYTQEVIKIKFEPTKLNKDGLHRRPEFEDVKPGISSTSASRPANQNNLNTVTPSRPSMQQTIPPHVRSEVQQASGSGSTSNSATNQQYQQPTGLNTPITTPAHASAQRQPQPQIQHQNLQQVNEPARPHIPTSKPLSAQTPAKSESADNDDELYGFNSDDDAFLANADLGPAFGGTEYDLGRPIVADVDMGRPIDHEEGLLRRPDEDQGEEQVVTNNRPPAQNGSTSNSSSSSRSNPSAAAAKSRHELIAAVLSAGADEKNVNMNNIAVNKPSAPQSGLAAGMLSKHLPQQHQSRPSGMSANGASSTSTSFSSSSSGMRPPPPPPQHRATSLAQQNHQRYMNQRQSNQNQNHNPNVPHVQQASSTTLVGADATKRAPTPSSMGGFNFPPGANLLQTAGGAAPSLSGGSGSGIGMKRPADVMSASSTSNFRAGRPGMGLRQQQQQQQQPLGAIGPNSGSNYNGRSVLGALDITEGGDVKRRRS